MVLLVAEKVGFKTKKNIIRDNRKFYKIKGSIHQDDTTIINIYVPNKRISKCMNFCEY